MWWRLTHSEFSKQKGEKNKKALKNIVDSGQIPGIIAYAEGNPIGWCSISPREAYPRLERFRILKSIDDKPVWSIVCFFVKKEFRRKEISFKILRAPIDYVKHWAVKLLKDTQLNQRKAFLRIYLSIRV